MTMSSADEYVLQKKAKKLASPQCIHVGGCI